MKTKLPILFFCFALTAGAGGEPGLRDSPSNSPSSKDKGLPSSFVGPGAHPGVAPFEAAAFPTPPTPLDAFVSRQLKQLGIQPANPCSDAVFIRRVYLDVIGTLPTADEVTAFLNDKMPNKRSLLVDKLLARGEFAEYWAMKWCDLLRVKSEFPINLWPNAVQAFHHWIRSCITRNVPYDKFVRAMLTASGSNYSVPEVNFYRAVQSKEPSGLAQAVALTFMGTRAEKWPKERLSGMAAFFRQVGYKATGEWKEEIVFNDPGKSGSGTQAFFPDGTLAKPAPDLDPREVFSNWLISPRNPWFTRNIANRVWSWLMGRGIINEPDDIRPDNPPGNPELLAYLEGELIRSRYDLKLLYRLILNSNTYQASSIPADKNPQAADNFASYPLRRLDAEVLIDALNQITGATDDYTSQIPEPYTYIPENQRAISMADASVTSSFLEMFGRSARNTGLETERNNRPSATQELHLLNSKHIQSKLELSIPLRLLTQKGGKPREVADRLYLTILSRYPTNEELKIIADYATPKIVPVNATPPTAGPTLSTGSMQEASPTPAPTPAKPVRRNVMMDLAWALINSPEFLYRH